MSDIVWSFSTTLNDVNSINDVESKFVITLPHELKDIIINNNGGYPSKSKVSIPGFGETDMKMLLSFNKEDAETVYDIMDYFAKKYHGRVIPFAVDSGSGYFCVKDNYIVFISEGNSTPIPIAENVSSFLNQLF